MWLKPFTKKSFIAALALALLAFLSVLAVYNRQTLREKESVAAISKTQELLLAVETLSFAASEIENNSRAYILTGQPIFFKSYQHSKQEALFNTAGLRTLLAAYPVQLGLLDTLASQINTRVNFADSIISSNKNIKDAQPTQVATSAGAGAYLEKVTGLTTLMQEDANKLLKVQKQKSMRETVSPKMIFAAIALLVLFLIILIFWNEKKYLQQKEQKEANDKLTKADKHFRMLADSIKDYAIFMLDAQGLVVSWSSGAEYIKDYHEEEILGRSFEIFYREQDIKEGEPRHNLEMTALYGRYETEGWRLKKDGTPFWASVVFTTLKNDTGNLYGYSKITRDISEKRKIQEERELLLRQIDQASDAIYTVDLNRRIKSWNRGAEILYGFTAAEVLNREIIEVLKINIKEPEINSAVEQLNNKDYWVGEMERTAKSGEAVYVRSSVTAVRSSSSGDISGYVSVNVDITRQKKLLEQVSHLASIVEQSSEAIFSRDLNHRIISWNKGAEGLFGYSKAEAIGNNASALKIIKLAGSEIAEVESKLFKSGTWKSELDFYHKKGEKFFVSVTATLIKNSKGENTSVNFIVKDISTRKKMEEHLTGINEELERRVQERTEQILVSEKKYRYLFENNPLPMWVIDADSFRFLDVNETAVNHYGYSRQEFLSMTELEIWPEADKTALVKTDRSKLKEQGTDKPGLWKHLKKDGSIIQVEISEHQVNFDNKNAALVLINDVTQKIKAEQKLAANEMRYMAMVENNEDIISVLDENMVVTYRSSSAARITGWQNDEFAKVNAAEYLHPDYRKYMQEQMKKCLSKQGIPVPVTLQVRHKNGQYIWLEGTINNLLHDPSVEGIITNVRDVTQRVQAVAQLTSSEIRFRSLIENISDAIVLNDAESNILYQSPSVTRILGYNKQERKGRKVLEYVHPDNRDDFVSLYQVLKARPGVPISFQYRFLHKNGHYIWLEGIVTNLLHNPAVNAYVANYRDITERKVTEIKINNLNTELEEKVNQRTEQLKKSMEDLESFSYSVSHDLRAPLRAIIGFSTILEEDYGSKMDDEARRITAVIKNNTGKMGNLIDDLLTFSRMGRQDLLKMKIDSTQMVHEIREMLDNMQNNGKKILWHIPLLPAVYADISSIRQVWVNLLSNAFKYSGKNETPEIEVGFFEQNSQNVFFVKDNGVGFDNRYKDKLFKVFQRLHSAEEFEGTGIGLAIVQKIVARHGGRVWAEAELNKGASFYFSLPAN
jgi:PAS domain S-box-containing protein